LQNLQFFPNTLQHFGKPTATKELKFRLFSPSDQQFDYPLSLSSPKETGEAKNHSPRSEGFDLRNFIYTFIN